MSIKFSTTPDGRRAEERTSQIVLDDGSVQNVIEHYEEQVPMKVTKKVTQKMISVPVEEKVETYDDDGSVNTVIKSLTDQDLSLEKPKPVSLEDVLDQVKELQDKLNKKEESKAESVLENAPKVSFMDGLFSKINNKAENAVVLEDKKENVMVTALTYVGWAIVAYLAASVVFHLVV